MTLEEEVAARIKAIRIVPARYQHSHAYSHYNIMDGNVCLGGSIDTLEAAQIRLSDQQARAAIAVIEPRIRAEERRAADLQAAVAYDCGYRLGLTTREQGGN